MKEEIYKNIIENSKIAYLKINCKINMDNKFIGIDIIEQSEEFKKLFKVLTDNNVLNKDITQLIINKWISENFKKDDLNKFIENVIKTGSKRLKFKTRKKGKHVIVDIYYMEDYLLLIYNIDDNVEYNDNEFKMYSWSKDLNGRYIDINDNNKQNYNSIIGKKDKDIWEENDIEQIKINDNEIICSKYVKTFYEVLTKKNGEKLYLESTKWPMLDENNKIIGIKGISIEIDDKLAFEKNIQNSKEYFKEITQYSDSVFIIRDKKRALYVSPSFKQVFEEEPYELYKNINKLDGYFKRVKSNDYNLDYKFDFNKTNEGIGKIKLSNGKEKWIWSKFKPMRDFDGSINKRIGILTDITEKKKIEEEQMQFKLNYFTNLSHEIRTPINLISSTIQIIKLNLNKLSPKEENKFKKYIKIMEINILRIEKLINNLLDSTKVEEGFINFSPISSDIIKFVENICDSIVEYAHYNKMNIIFDTDSEEEVVLFDPDIIERVLLNLLSNAIKFNKINGNIYVNMSTKDDKVTISIKDEGIGIPKEKIDYIFKRFRQIKDKDNNIKQGSGIGLYLVKSLVELHGGTIEVKSKINKGSEFIVSIPKKESVDNEDLIEKNKQSISRHINVEFSDI